MVKKSVKRTLANHSSRHWVIAAVVGAIAVGFIAGAARGNSEVGDRGYVANNAGETEAAAVLDGRLPLIRTLAPGMTREVITVDGADKPVGSRFVHVPYAIGGKGVARLDIWKGKLGATDGASAMIGSQAGSVAVHQIGDGTSDVRYTWETGGLSFSLHVNLSHGITRDLADAMAASVK